MAPAGYRSKRRRDGAGFSLLELLIVVSVIGIIASIAIPRYTQYREIANAHAVASNLRTFAKGFQTYSTVYGQYPPDWHTNGPYNLPPNMENFIPGDIWVATTPFGGNYNWEGPNNYPYAGISIYNSSAGDAPMELVDELVDDGDLTQGGFRKTPNGRYTYIIEE